MRDRGAAPTLRAAVLSRAGAARLGRAAAVVLVTVAAVAAALDQFHTPWPKSSTAGPTEFSAERAMAHVEALARVPRPQGSGSAAGARSYIVQSLGGLGLTPELQTANVVRTTDGTNTIFASRVLNVLARTRHG